MEGGERRRLRRKLPGCRPGDPARGHSQGGPGQGDGSGFVCVSCSQPEEICASSGCLSRQKWRARAVPGDPGRSHRPFCRSASRHVPRARGDTRRVGIGAALHVSCVSAFLRHSAGVEGALFFSFTKLPRICLANSPSFQGRPLSFPRWRPVPRFSQSSHTEGHHLRSTEPAETSPCSGVSPKSAHRSNWSYSSITRLPVVFYRLRLAAASGNGTTLSALVSTFN